MYFEPYLIRRRDGARVAASIEPATQADLEQTRRQPHWQTDWTSDYLADPAIEKYALKTGEQQLAALGAYRVVGRQAYVYIVYVESAPSSNPTLTAKPQREYDGVGEVMLAFGIKFSIDSGCRGDILFEAKTDELAEHYARDFRARPVAGLPGGPKRFMLADEDAWRLFSKFLTEEDAE